MPNEPCTPERLRELLDYNPDTGVLTWRERKPDDFEDGKHTAEHNCKKWNAANAGKIAMNCVNKRGYKTGTVDSKSIVAHRICYAHYYGAWPHDQIDHINHDRADNRINNLRCVTNRDNQRNAGVRRDNTSGICGVSWHKTIKKWQSKINTRNGQKYLGLFDTIEEAAEARKQAEIKHGYHENHGKDL